MLNTTPPEWRSTVEGHLLQILNFAPKLNLWTPPSVCPKINHSTSFLLLPSLSKARHKPCPSLISLQIWHFGVDSTFKWKRTCRSLQGLRVHLNRFAFRHYWDFWIFSLFGFGWEFRFFYFSLCIFIVTCAISWKSQPVLSDFFRLVETMSAC